MAKLEDALESAVKEDPNFIGTISFKNEEITLPDGSTMALGIDHSHWVLVYQKERRSPFIVYEYNSGSNTLHIDKRPGTSYDYKEMRRLVAYFFSHARTEDLVTILPPGSGDYA